MLAGSWLAFLIFLFLQRLFKPSDDWMYILIMLYIVLHDLVLVVNMVNKQIRHSFYNVPEIDLDPCFFLHLEVSWIQ